jgi:hypothetical protein
MEPEKIMWSVVDILKCTLISRDDQAYLQECLNSQ